MPPRQAMSGPLAGALLLSGSEVDGTGGRHHRVPDARLGGLPGASEASTARLPGARNRPRRRGALPHAPVEARGCRRSCRGSLRATEQLLIGRSSEACGAPSLALPTLQGGPGHHGGRGPPGEVRGPLEALLPLRGHQGPLRVHRAARLLRGSAARGLAEGATASGVGSAFAVLRPRAAPLRARTGRPRRKSLQRGSPRSAGTGLLGRGPIRCGQVLRCLGNKWLHQLLR
mmetsp:Transcript_125090/g.400672  ORF Transcript_125090/g.400672 Transcript_125090/m.400672 type:complete len:230 (+) Transcript_125090:57-746(+)